MIGLVPTLIKTDPNRGWISFRRRNGRSSWQSWMTGTGLRANSVCGTWLRFEEFKHQGIDFVASSGDVRAEYPRINSSADARARSSRVGSCARDPNTSCGPYSKALRSEANVPSRSASSPRTNTSHVATTAVPCCRIPRRRGMRLMEIAVGD